MTRIKKATPERMNLRQRLDWLLMTIHAANYPIRTGAGELAIAYSEATGMPYILHKGLLRSRYLTSDLAELHERGLIECEIITLRQKGRMAVVKKYELTAEGLGEAKSIVCNL